MKQLFALMTAVLILGSAVSVQARDDIRDYVVADVLATEKAKEILGEDIRFYFGNQKHPAVSKKLGEIRTNKKTNGVGKSDQEACEWVFLSAMKALREHAQSKGANAIVNIRSNYRNNTTSSPTTFQCGSGAIMSGTALIGDVVVLK